MNHNKLVDETLAIHRRRQLSSFGRRVSLSFIGVLTVHYNHRSVTAGARACGSEYIPGIPVWVAALQGALTELFVSESFLVYKVQHTAFLSSDDPLKVFGGQSNEEHLTRNIL